LKSIKEEIDAWRKRDPIPLFENKLIEQKILNPQDIEIMHDEVEKRLQSSVEVARQDPFPDVKEVTEHVYA